MKEHIIYQRLYGLVVMSSFMFLSDTLSLKGKKLDFYGRHDTYVSLANTIPELSRFTVCIDLVSMVDKSSYWMAFSYITKSTILGREVIDLGLAGDHQQLILYNLGKTFYIRRRLTPLQWHTVCLIWDGAKGRLELFLDKERILVIMDRPHSLTPNGTLVLGHFPKNRENQVQSRRLHFTGSLYYFQLWDRVLEKEEFMKCLDGNIVSWEEDIWLVHKIIPTPDRRLRCFVFENMTVQERSTTLSQQIDLTIPSQITGLKPQETIHSSTVMSKSMPVFVTDYTTISYSNTISPPLATMTVSKILNTSLSGTATFADILSTSIATTLPTQSTSIHATTGSMKITKYPSSESTRTTKMVEAIATEKFHPTTATNFFSTSGFIKNSFVSKTSATESQSAIMKTTLFSTTESTSNSTTSWPKHKSTDFAALSISASAQEYLIATAVSTVPWSTVEETTAITTGTGSSSAFTPESLLTSTAAPMNSEVPRNQTSSTLATPDMEVTFTVHSVRPIETTPVLRTAETELASPKFQGVSLPSMEDAMSTSMPKETSSMALYPMTSSIVIGTQSVQMVTDAESTHTALTPGITLAPTVAETMLSPTSARPVCTQNTPTAGDHMLTLTPTKSASTPEASESVPASVTDETAHWFSTNKTTWTSRPGQTLLTSTNSPTILTVVPNENFTSAFHDNTTNTEISSTGINIAPPEASTESKATASTDATAARYTTALFKSTSPQFADFSSVSETTSVTSLPEFKVTTLLLKTIPVSTVAVSEHSLIPRETVVPSVATTADMKRNLSTEESTSETTQAETNGTSTSVDTTTPVPKTATTPRVNATVMRKETTSHHLGETSTIATVAEASPFSAVLEEATDESSQTASVTFSPFPDTEKLTTTLDNKIVTSEMGWSWFSTKLMKSTPKNSYNGTTEILNSTHTYTTPWTSETPEGNSTPSPTSGSTQTFNPLGASTTSILETSFSTAPTDRTAMSLSASILPAQTTALHFSATTTPVTHTVSPPNNISVVTSVVVSDENKVTTPEPSTVAIDFSTSVLSDVSTLSSATMTTASGTPLGKTASTTSNTLSTHRDSLYTTSEATVISATMTFTAAPSLKKTLVPSLRPLTPMTTKAKSTLPSTSTGTVTPSIHTLLCSKPPPDNIPIVTSAHVISTTATPVATQPVSQVEETSTPALSFPYTSSGGEDVVSLATGTTQTSTVDATMPSHTSANKLATLGGIHISPSSKLPVNTQVSTQLVTGTSTSSSDKEQMTISLGKTPRTMQVTEISPSKDSFISYSQTTSDLEMTDMGFSETTEISNHQTHLSTEIPLGTSPDGNSAVPSTSASTQSIHILTSSNTVDVHISEMSTSLEKTSLPSQALTITKILPPEKESASVLSVSLESVSCGKCPFHTPKSVEMIVSSSSVTHPVSTVQDTSFANITTSRTTISTSLSHLSSLKTQPEVTSVASSISESTQAFPKSLMPSTTGLSNANFTVNSNDGITTAVSVPNAPTTLSGETSLETSIPIYKMSPSPVNVTAFASKNVSTTPTILITKPSKTTRPGCLKSPSVATSGPLSEMSSMPVNDSAFSPTVVSSDTSREVGSFSTLLSSTTPRTTMNIQTSTLAVTPVTYAGPTSKKSSVISSAFTNSEMTNMSSKITPTSVFAPTEPTFPSTKTISTMARVVTSDVGTTASSLLNSKNTEAISSIPKTTFSPLPSTTQLSLRDETTTPSILPGITNSSFSTMSSGKVTDFTNTYSRTAVPESGLSPTPSDNAHTSLATQVSPSLTSLKRTPGPTENVKAITAYLSSHTKKMTSSSENTFLTTELTKSATSVNTSALYSPWTPSSTTTLSLTSLLHSLHSTEAKFSTPKLSPPPTSQMVEFPVLGTRITSSNTQSLLTTSWNTPTMTRVPTPNKMETETLHLIPGSLSTFAASQTGLVSRGVMATSSFPTPEILPSFGPSESRSSSISSRVLSTTLADIKHPFEKKSTFVTPGTTLLSSPPTVSKAATSPMLTWILSSLPSGSPLTMGSNASPAPTSSIVKVSKSTFLTSDTIPTYPFTNFATLPFATGSTILTKTPPVSTLGSITSGSPTSLPISTKTADATVHIFASPEASSRTTMTDNSRTVSQSLTYSGMSASPSTTDHAHTISVGSTPPPPSPTKMTAWSRFPAASASSALIPPKPTLDSLINTITTKPTATGASIPLISTEVTHPTATVSSLISSSFETTWPDSTSSIPSTESFTSPTAARSPVSFYNIEMSLSISEEEPKVPITSVINEFARNWLNSVFQHSEFSLANLAIQING
uniref:Adhesion G-protein coupled receptor G4 n=1 Tax=Castor canadensis TaxID=51338 RepID=A0A8B7TIV9_CASCN